MDGGRAAGWAWAGAAIAAALLLVSLTGPHVGYALGAPLVYALGLVPLALLLVGWAIARKEARRQPAAPPADPRA